MGNIHNISVTKQKQNHYTATECNSFHDIAIKDEKYEIPLLTPTGHEWAQ